MHIFPWCFLCSSLSTENFYLTLQSCNNAHKVHLARRHLWKCVYIKEKKSLHCHLYTMTIFSCWEWRLLDEQDTQSILRDDDSFQATLYRWVDFYYKVLYKSKPNLQTSAIMAKMMGSEEPVIVNSQTKLQYKDSSCDTGQFYDHLVFDSDFSFTLIRCHAYILHIMYIYYIQKCC